MFTRHFKYVILFISPYKSENMLYTEATTFKFCRRSQLLVSGLHEI